VERFGRRHWSEPTEVVGERIRTVSMDPRREASVVEEGRTQGFVSLRRESWIEGGCESSWKTGFNGMPVGPKPGVPPSSFDGVWKRNGSAAALLLGVTRIDGKVRETVTKPEQPDQSKATSAVSKGPTLNRALRRIQMREWSGSQKS
jgi:hypothetical protein